MLIADISQRQQALDVSSSYIVQAPAGSGKTGVLTLRILTLLTVVDKPEDILAITFTKKAAAEMRLRVMEALQLAAGGKEPHNEYELQFYQLGRKVLERDRQKQWGLQNNQNRLRLQTIDSFCSSVIRNRPLSSGLGVQFNVADDPSDLYSAAAKELLKSLDDTDLLADALRRVLGLLDNQYQKLEGMLCQMLALRDHWLQDITELHANMDQLRALLEQSLSHINEEGRDRLLSYFGGDFVSELTVLTDYAKNQLFALNVKHTLLADAETEIQALKQQLSLFVTKSKSPALRSRFDKRDGFPSGSGSEKKRAAEYKERAKSFVHRLETGGEPGFEQLIEFLNLPDEHLDEPSWQLLQDLILIVRFAAAHLKLVFQQRQQVDFSEIALAALSTLGEPDHPNDVALILDATINHILIDEFQDTSFVQIELLERLTAGWQMGDGRSLFLVGDPMQSIYAFRQADVGLFIRLWEQCSLGDIPLNPLLLTTNFRSSETIIRWINSTFEYCFPSRSDQRKGAVSYSKSVAAKAAEEHDGVSIDWFRMPPDFKVDSGILAEANWIADRIVDVPQERSIAVLVKGKSHVLKIAAILRQRNIAFQAVEIESLQDSQIVSDLMALARAVWSPGDKTAWFALLRGPWCGMTLVELEQLVEIDALPWMAIQKLSRLEDSPFSQLTHRKLMHLHYSFSKAYEERHRRSWSDNLYSVMLDIGLPGAFEFDISVQVIEVFFELLERIDTLADVPDFSRLEKKLAELFVPPDVFPEGERTVQIMSMHKSKGLEFDVVFLPQLQRKSRADDKPLILIDKQTSITSQQQELFVAPLDAGKSEGERSVFDYLWGLNKQRSRNEACRLLYVATTRAKRRLYLSGIVFESEDGGLKKPDPNSLMALFWPHIDRIDGVTVQQVESSNVEREPGFIRAPDPEFFNFTADSVSSSGGYANRHPTAVDQDLDRHTTTYRREVGVLVHRFLEQWAKTGSEPGLESESQKHQWSQELLRLGVAYDYLESACQLVGQALCQLTKSKTAQWIFKQSHQQSYAELAVAHINDQQMVQHLVIDRTFVEDGVRHIIDYKLSEPSSDSELDLLEFLKMESLNYQPQLAGYKAALNAIEPMETKTYLYFPLIDQLHEVIC